MSVTSDSLDLPALTLFEAVIYQNMEISQSEKVEDLPVPHPNDPICFINELAPELLSDILQFACIDDDAVNNFEVESAFFRYNEIMRLHSDPRDYENRSEDEDEVEGEGEGEDEDDEDTPGPPSSLCPFDFQRPLWFPFSIVVSHVCRHWRNVALSTPSLWTTIVVGSAPYELESSLLERSKSLPVDIYANFAPQHVFHTLGAPPDEDVKLLLSMLIPHIHRWRTMQFTASGHHMGLFASAVSDLSIPAAPQLTTLRLHQYIKREEPEISEYPNISRHFTLFGGSAPLLTTIVLWGVYVDWDQPWIAAASNLRKLELAYHPDAVRPFWNQFATILRGAPALDKLILHKSGPSGHPVGWFIEPTPGGPADLNHPIQLSHVTSFDLMERSQARASGLLFRKFHLPALTELILNLGPEEEDYNHFTLQLIRPVPFPSPVQEQSCSLLRKLETFKLISLPFQRPEDIEMLYGELQNVTTLSIPMLYLRESVNILATRCTLAGRGDIWMPQLVTLHTVGGPWDVHCDLVRMRRDAGVPLRSLHVRRYTTFSKLDVKWLRENLETFEVSSYFEPPDVE